MNTTIGEAVDKKLPSAGPSFQRGHQRERGKGGFLQSSIQSKYRNARTLMFESHHGLRKASPCGDHFIFWFCLSFTIPRYRC